MVKYLAFALSLALVACNNSETKTDNANTESKQDKKAQITLKGSDTVLPVAQKLAEEYKKNHNEANIAVTGGGTGVGVAALMDGTTTIAMASRPLKMDEKLKLDDAGKKFKEVLIARDALAVVNHPSNSVKQLTHEQIRDIFTGKITNWKQVGGKDMKIVAYSRESSSGTYEFFKEHVMDKQNYASTVLNMPATGAIVQSVSQTPGAIGYVGLAYVNSAVQDIAVSYDNGKTFTNASMDNAINKSYPVSRDLFFYVLEKDEPSVKDFVDFILSDNGQRIVKEVGYVPLR